MCMLKWLSDFAFDTRALLNNNFCKRKECLNNNFRSIYKMYTYAKWVLNVCCSADFFFRLLFLLSFLWEQTSFNKIIVIIYYYLCCAFSWHLIKRRVCPMVRRTNTHTCTVSLAKFINNSLFADNSFTH